MEPVITPLVVETVCAMSANVREERLHITCGTVILTYLTNARHKKALACGLVCGPSQDDVYNTQQQRTKAIGTTAAGPRPLAFSLPGFLIGEAQLFACYNN